MKVKISSIFLELTNHCNFNCAFCPDTVMTRKRGLMDYNFACHLIDQIAEGIEMRDPIQLHIMGEPLLHPRIMEIINYIHSKGLKIRLFTNGALLAEKMANDLFKSGLYELVISIQTPTESLYKRHRKTSLSFENYINQIKKAIALKVQQNYPTKIYIHYLNTKNFPVPGFEVVHTNEFAWEIIDVWREFAESFIGQYRLPQVQFAGELLEGFMDKPLDSPSEEVAEILPGVKLAFKKCGTFSDGLLGKVRIIEHYLGKCPAPFEQLAVLQDGTATLCCVDYDGKMAVGNAKEKSLIELWKSDLAEQIRGKFKEGILGSSLCQRCRGTVLKDDYSLGFGKKDANIRLEKGFYNLEKDYQYFRWTAKKAEFSILSRKLKKLCLSIGNSFPDPISFYISMGEEIYPFNIGPYQWKDLILNLPNRFDLPLRVVIEAEKIHIPSQLGLKDDRELGLMVAKVALL